MRKQVRKLRHWKQRFDKNADFIWRRAITYAGKLTVVGDPLPEAIADNPTKLRRFWESGTIELAEFEDPNVVSGLVESIKPAMTLLDLSGLPEGVTVYTFDDEDGHFMVSTPDDGVEVNGLKALGELLAELRVELGDEDETDEVEETDETEEDDDFLT